MKSKKVNHVASRLLSTLSPYAEADGEYIDLGVLTRELPFLRWDLTLLGESASRKKEQVVRRLPLLGRTRNASKVVVLLSSLQIWLEHYNKEYRPESTAMAMDDLRKAQKRYIANLRRIKLESALKNGTKVGAKSKVKTVSLETPVFETKHLPRM